MTSFESRVANVSTQLEESCRQMKDEKKNSDWNLKVDVETRIDKFMGEVQLTNEKEREHTKNYKKGAMKTACHPRFFDWDSGIAMVPISTIVVKFWAVLEATYVRKS